ncbi:ester cyclase [Mycolicibacterium stellerae]|uniref:ester cyclase n=1 Tax=Mycolicibacterium stellerae TaxID=2358193 RepID=UPI000F0B5519|nr:ester cyclase [Mycolicibacterium stellerae]
MTEHVLLTAYRGYLECLNERQWPRLGEYVADELSYNGKRMTLADYRAMLEADVHAIPDLQFHAELLLADDHIVACRLYFRCNPRHAFLGFEPPGREVSFPEHVFYRFDDRRIVEVWSVIDKQAIRDQDVAFVGEF